MDYKRIFRRMFMHVVKLFYYPVLLTCCSYAAHAETFTVTTLEDEVLNFASGRVGMCSVSDCSLREAISAAQASPNLDLVVFAPGLSGTIKLNPAIREEYVQSPVAGDPLRRFGATAGRSAFSISTPIIIDGENGGLGIVLDMGGAASNARHFTVELNGNLTLNSLTLTNGHAVGGSAFDLGGGGAGLGGSIFVYGDLTVNNTLFINNTAIGGATFDADNTDHGGGGGGLSGNAGAGGGGILTDGDVITDEEFHPVDENFFPVNIGTVVAEGGRNSVVIESETFGSGGVTTRVFNTFADCCSGYDSFGRDGSFGGGGGGSITNTLNAGRGGKGGFGGGGGIGSFSDGNGGFGGGGAYEAFPGFGGGNGYVFVSRTRSGGSGMGAAIFQFSGTTNISNTTFFRNMALGGASASGVPATLGKGLGNNLFLFGGASVIDHATFAGNDGNGSINTENISIYVYSDDNDFDKDNDGDLDPVADVQLAVNHSILADTLSCKSSADGESLNLPSSNLYTDTNCGSTPVPSINGLADDLANNGGVTHTLALEQGSNAVDAASTSQSLTDQRGAMRPQGIATDIGAFELSPSLSLSSESVSEGDGLLVLTVTRDVVNSEPLSVELFSIDTTGTVNVPVNVSIEANEASSQVMVGIIDNDVIDTQRNIGIRASAIGFVDARVALDILDDDDDDGDTISDLLDNCPNNANTDQADLDMDTIGDECDSDMDGDGLGNIYEAINGLDPRDASDRNADPDGDGFSNIDELRFGTDPQSPDVDTNNNGIPDSTDARRQRGAKAVISVVTSLLLDN